MACSWPSFSLRCDLRCGGYHISLLPLRQSRIYIQRLASCAAMAEAVKTRAAASHAKGEKHQRILEAAICVIAEKGFFQARVAEIAERAGVADGTIYLYFKNKEEILKAAITSAFKEFLLRARDELKRISDPVEQLNRLAYLHLSALGANKPLAAVFHKRRGEGVDRA